LRYTNNMAERACHVVASATQVGLTQVLGASKLELQRFSASVASHGHSTPLAAGFGRPASVTFPLAHSSSIALRSPASVALGGARSRKHCRPSKHGLRSVRRRQFMGCAW